MAGPVAPGATACVCVANDETLFNLTASGKPDAQGRPTYYLQNERYGAVQWSSAGLTGVWLPGRLPRRSISSLNEESTPDWCTFFR